MRGHKYVFSYVLSSYFVKRSSCSIFCYYISFFILMLFLCIVIMIFVFFKLAAIISLEWQHPQVASLTPPLSLRCLYQARKMRGHVFVLGVDVASFYDFLLDFRLFWLCGILDLFWLCGILDLFWLCGILDLFWLCGILELFWLCGILFGWFHLIKYVFEMLHLWYLIQRREFITRHVRQCFSWLVHSRNFCRCLEF